MEKNMENEMDNGVFVGFTELNLNYYIGEALCYI